MNRTTYSKVNQPTKTASAISKKFSSSGDDNDEVMAIMSMTIILSMTVIVMMMIIFAW